MSNPFVRLDEADKTPAQIDQRERTYEAARFLRSAGIACEVREFFTGSSKTCDAAGIFLSMNNDPR